MTRRPSIWGTIKNGMYAGVGTMTAEPGGVKRSIVTSKAVMTSGRWCTRPAGTCHP